MKKIKTVTFRFDRNDFPKEGEWYFDEDKFKKSGINFGVFTRDIYAKTETEEVWKPKISELYYWVSELSTVSKYTWEGDDIDDQHFNIGNCFQTQSEAQAMADKFKELLKGGVE